MKKVNWKKICFRIRIPLISIFILFGCGMFTNKTLGSPPKIKVGVGETIITPSNPVGYPMEGYDRHGFTSTGIHDNLYTRSIVVEGADHTAILLMTVAVVNISEPIMDLIRIGVEKQTGIPFKNIAISSTHTHSGPVIGSPDSSYCRFFIGRCIKSAVQAWESRVPGRIGFGSTEIFGLAMNDRTMNFGGMPADPQAAVIKIEDAKGKLIGVFFNFGCHPSTLDLHNLLFTEDWPFFSIKGIKDKIGTKVIVGYFQSAQGDAKVGYQAELSAIGADMYGVRTFEYAEKKGLLMTDAVLKLLPSIKTSGDLVVKAVYDHFNFPRRTTYPYTHSEALQWQREARAKLADKEKLLGIKIGPRTLDTYKADLWLANQAVDKSLLIESTPNPAPIRMPMQAIRLGNTVFVTFPGEVFTEIGLEVKKQSPYQNTFILGVAGDFGGYLPSAKEYLEQGYAVNGSPFAPECEQIMIRASHELINRVSDVDTSQKNSLMYSVKKLKKPMNIDGNWNKAEWLAVKGIELTNYMGKIPPFRPIVHAKMMYDEENLYVIFQVNDRYVRSVIEEYNGPVSTEACVEFFFSPDTSMPDRYFNLEINAGGTPLMAYHIFPQKESQPLSIEDLKKIEIAHSLPRKVDPEIDTPVIWTIEYRLPFSVLEKFSSVSHPKPGVTWRANFYKTASMSSNPHYITWSFVDNPVPNFHLPRFFGQIRFAK